MSKYVDADATLKLYKGYCGSIGTFSKLYAEWLKRVLAEMPAADVQEVRHGKWITDGNVLSFAPNAGKNTLKMVFDRRIAICAAQRWMEEVQNNDCSRII